MRRDLLAVLLSTAMLAATALPAAAESDCGYKSVSASAKQTQQTAQAQSNSSTVTR